MSLTSLFIAGFLQNPLFIEVFLFIMAFLISLDIALLLETKKLLHSDFLNYLQVANIISFTSALTYAIIIDKFYYISNIASPFYYLLVGIYIIIYITNYLVLYYLIKPIVKRELNLFRVKYILFYLFSPVIILWTFKVASVLPYPGSSYPTIFYVFLFFSFTVIIYLCVVLFSISRDFRQIGFVHKPFLLWSFAGSALALSVGLIIWYCFSFVDTADIFAMYYPLSFYLITVLLMVTYNLKAIIEYPSLIRPELKTLMPVDLSNVVLTLSLAFLVASFYSTVQESQKFIIYQNVPFVFGIAFLLPVFLGTMVFFTYLKAISARTKLRCWVYLKHGVLIHIAVTFYVSSMAFLSWNNAPDSTKTFYLLFALASFAFYLFLAFDLRRILVDQNIKPIFNGLDFCLTLISFYSWFFLILLAVSLSYGKFISSIEFEFISYPGILLAIAFFLFALGVYFNITKKGFVEILKKNIWGELSYSFAFIAFVFLYLFYCSLSTNLQQFPYHDLSFPGYFLVLLMEILSARTLVEKTKNIRGTKNVTHLLNFYTLNFLRTDYLEDLWKKMVERYIGDRATDIKFDSSKRRFDLDLENVDEKTKLTIAVGILLEMHNVPNVEKVMIHRKSLKETKEEIEDILKEKILMLPEELRCVFDECVYYPILYERVVNKLLTSLKTFFPSKELKKIFEQLASKSELSKCISFEAEKIAIKKEARFSREEFLDFFRFYLDTMEELFPFKRCLLHELVREEIKREFDPYNITVGRVLDIVPTGLEELDRQIGGGLAMRSATLLLAEETTMKHKILLSFVKQGLIDGNIAIYATSKQSFSQIVSRLLLDIKNLQNFVMIDLYEGLYSVNRIFRVSEEEHRIITPLSKIFFMRSLVKVIKSQPTGISKIVVLDVFDDFSRYYATEEIHEMLQQQIDGLKRWNCTSLIVLTPQSYLITKEGIKEVKKNFDNVMVMLSGEDKDAKIFIEKLYHETPPEHLIHLRR